MAAQAKTRVYVVVEHSDAGVLEETLVEAGSQSQSIRHKVKGRFTASAAKTADVIRLMGAGLEVEKADSDAE